ncbi:MAG: fasciclin domain-containing protein [Bdellovibrionales bacterium]|nr:fasciclin domain-containing protein [Bdellovibrionales bacterium]
MTSVACSDSNNNSPRPANGDQGGFEQTTPGTIVDEATKAGVFNTLLAAAGAAELVDALNGDGPLTVFAPTDAAFAALPAGTVETLLKPENKQQLTDILLYHVVAGSVVASDLEMKKSLETLFGQDVMVEMVDGELIINKSKIIIKDIKATNGVIQVIDAVLLP